MGLQPLQMGLPTRDVNEAVPLVHEQPAQEAVPRHLRQVQSRLGLAQGLVKPHIGKTIRSTVDEINAGLQSMKSGKGTIGKVAVTVDEHMGTEDAIAGRRATS